jgi:hypothetical protein
MSTSTKLKVQLVIEGQKWPYVGNGFVNKDGSFSIYLDQNVELKGGQKLFVRPARTAEKPAGAAEKAAE